MKAVRAKIVDTAFKSLDQSGDGTLSRDELARVFDWERHPEVLRREKTPKEVIDEMFDAFDDNRDGVVSREEFDRYYAIVSERVDDDGDFYTLVTRTWQLDQPKRIYREPLQRAAMAGYTTSNRLDATHKQHDSNVTGETYKSAGVGIERSQLSLDPFPLPKAGVAHKQTIGSHEPTSKMHHRTRTAAATAVHPPTPESYSTLGCTGRPGSLGFLNGTSSTQRAVGTGEFDPEVMATYEQGKAAEREAAARRAAAQAAPFRTAEPAAYARSSQVHAALTDAVNRERPARPTRDRAPTPASEEALREVLERQREDLRTRTLLGKPSRSGWTTTNQEVYSPVDTVAAVQASDRFASAPYVRGNAKSSDADVPAPRGANGWETEYSSTMQNRSDEVQRVSKYDAKGTFKLVNGAPQMSSAAHRPRETAVSTRSPTDVVPNHFVSTQRATYQ